MISVQVEMMMENMRIALVELWANRARSFLAILGIFIATAATISVISIMLGLNSYVCGFFSNRKDSISIASMPPAASARTLGRYTPVGYLDFTRMEGKIPEMRLMGYRVRQSGEIKYISHAISGCSLFASTVHVPEMRGAKVMQGMPFCERTFKAVRNPCWVQANFGERFSISGEVVGKYIEINGQRYVIAGITDIFEKTNIGDRRVQVLLQYENFCAVFGEPKSYGGELQLSKLPDCEMEKAKNAATAMLRRIHNLGPGDPNDFLVETAEKEKAEFDTFAMVAGGVLFSIVSVSLLVGGIGIMNIMLVSVRERTKEIGIRMAVGARRRDIMMQFITESVTLCCIGGILGIVVGQSLALAITRPLGVVTPLFGTVYFSTSLILGSLGFSAAVGIFFGVLPARDAARLDPIEALRYE